MRIILISGPQGSGKTTLARALEERLQASGPVYRLKFADPLYAMHDAIGAVAARYGIPFAVKEGALLQYLGTEWGRAKDPDLWVKALKYREAVIAKADAYTGRNSIAIIDDCRFPNELEAFPDAFKIRLTAAEEARRQRAEGWRENTAHVSETALDALPPSTWQLLLDTTASTPAETLERVVSAASQFFTDK